MAADETVDELQTVVDELLSATGASRVTLRQDRSGAFFPVVREALAVGVESIREVEAPNMPQQPVVREIVQGRQVVQDDCLSAFDDPDFHEMLELYGGMRAQIVTPVMVDGVLTEIISVHQLGSAREWEAHDIQACSDAATKVASVSGRGQ